MKSCAFLTLDETGDYVIDDEHAIAPLEALGWRVSTVSWRQTAVPWREFDLVIIRSTWDYWDDVEAFLDTLAHIDRETRLVNPLELVKWNLRKTYLGDLQRRGIPIVPTIWPQKIAAAGFAPLFRQLHNDELVIKPVVGANGQDAFRVSTGDSSEQLQAISSRFSGKPAMVQSFMPHILDEGEFSLFYFDGKYSHAILKVPVGGEFRSQEERGAEIHAIDPEPLLLSRALAALRALDIEPLYARIDFVRDESGDFRLMEQELIEPSLYLRMDKKAPGRFAAAVERRFG